jgi:hypothetical protein
MKRTLLVFLFAVSLVAANEEELYERITNIQLEANSKRYGAYSRADTEYRIAVSKTFELADRAEIYLLDFSMGSDGKHVINNDVDAFPISPYQKDTKILKSRKIPSKDIQQWRAAITSLVSGDDTGAGGVLCHYPAHGIRLYAGDVLLFETSICWACSNYFFTYEGESKWNQLMDIGNLKELLDEFMPIPESEQERFKKRMKK